MTTRISTQVQNHTHIETAPKNFMGNIIGMVMNKCIGDKKKCDNLTILQTGMK